MVLEQSLYAGIDFGTSGCRVVIIDDCGYVRARSTASLPAAHRMGACVEQDPNDWWTALEEALHTALQQVPVVHIRALAVNGTSATLLVTDANSRPLSPALMYNDSRAHSFASKIANTAPPESGAHGATSSLAKLLWLQQHLPDTRYALHQADWIAGQLCSRHAHTSDENNALKLGYDPLTRSWPDWLSRLGVREEILPRVLVPGQPIATIAPQWVRAWGLAPETLVVAGTTDSVAAFIAAGAHAPGEAVTSLGSTLVLKLLSKQPVFAADYGVYSHRLGDQWLAGGASNSGGAVLLKFFSQPTLAQMTPWLRPDRPTALNYYPLVVPGERFPVNDPALQPRLEPRPSDDVVFFQGMLEGMAAIEQQGYRRLSKLGAPSPTSVRSVGGGASNQAWTSIRARVLAIPVFSRTGAEPAYGTALLARWGVASSEPFSELRSLTPKRVGCEE